MDFEIQVIGLSILSGTMVHLGHFDLIGVIAIDLTPKACEPPQLRAVGGYGAQLRAQVGRQQCQDP
jgi:hypothetical protein